MESSIHGHHMYWNVWTLVIDEVLVCKQERHNIHNLFTVAMHKEQNDGSILLLNGPS